MRREARLKPAHGYLYPGVTPSVWESAAVLGEKVLACRLLLPSSGFVLSDRALNPGHFEFRGGLGPRMVAPERLVEDPRATAVDSALSVTS
jgi:hypothetical protein